MSNTPNRTKQVTSIASILGGKSELDGQRCTDVHNREWEIIQKHSGCELKGTNHKGVIPYWACYHIELPGLRLGRYDVHKGIDKTGPTILEELIRNNFNDGDLYRDEQQGLMWIIDTYQDSTMQLNGWDDNHWLPFDTLGVLSFGLLRKLSTREQRKAAKLFRPQR